MLSLIVIISFAALVTGIIVGDIWLAVNEYPGDTLSELIRGSASERPILYVLWGVLFGVLLGHWFW